MEYRIPCIWEMYGFIVVDADSLEEAITQADHPETALPKDGTYVEGSFEVDHGGMPDDPQEELKPTEKDPEIDKVLENITGRPRGGKECVTCGKEKMKPSDFRDEGSRKEAAISWMCQECQDKVFGGNDE